MDLTTVEKNLKERGFKVAAFATAKEAADYLNAQIDGESVSFGGSMTLSQMGLFESLGKHNKMFSHWNVPDGMNAAEVLKNASTCDNYLLSANGLAETGDIEKIDLRIGDITKKDLGGLPSYMTASNFGKLDDMATKNDLALGIVNMVFESIGMLAVFAARSKKTRDVVLTGNLSKMPQAVPIFEILSQMFDMNFVIPKNSEFATVIGAALAEFENEI